MYDPFKRARLKARKRARRTTASALTSLMGAMLTPAKPAKRKVPKAAGTAVKIATRKAKPASKPRAATGNGGQRPKAAGKPTVPATSSAKLTIPRGATSGSGTHVSEFGTLSYRIYIPTVAKAASEPLPLLVMLHGCGQSPEDFARGTGMNALAEEFGILVLYPEQDRRTQIKRCWHWYRRSDQGRGSGEPALLAGLVRMITDEQRADPSKVYVAGLSAGASMALILAAAYPDIFAAVGAHSGLQVGAAHSMASAMTAMKHGSPGLRPSVPMPTITFQGDADKVVNVSNGRFVAARALDPHSGLRRTERTGHAPGGRKYIRTSHRVGKGRSFTEHWVIEGGGHAWSGGNTAGSHTDPTGPDASREMIRFFLQHRTTKIRRSTSPT